MASAPAAYEIEPLRPWIECSFSRSPGPGGQNVNKVNTRVTLLFDFENCPAIADAHRGMIRRKLATRLAADGRLRVISSRERTQARNRAAAESRLLELLAEAVYRAPHRKPTRPTAGSVRRRITEKRQRSERARLRRRPGMDE